MPHSCSQHPDSTHCHHGVPGHVPSLEAASSSQPSPPGPQYLFTLLGHLCCCCCRRLTRPAAQDLQLSAVLADKPTKCPDPVSLPKSSRHHKLSCVSCGSSSGARLPFGQRLYRVVQEGTPCVCGEHVPLPLGSSSCCLGSCQAAGPCC